MVVTKPFGNGKITCREIRRNSAGCLRFRNECEKCRELQHIGEKGRRVRLWRVEATMAESWWSRIVLAPPTDCSGKRPLEGPLKAELEAALALARRSSQQYDGLLRRLEERMANTSFILDLLNRQFGWVSSLANRTDSTDSFSLQTVRLRTSGNNAL